MASMIPPVGINRGFLFGVGQQPYKENMELAEKVYNQTRKKYEIGTGSNVEISAAQTDLITAQNNYLSALYGAIVARIDYLKATGKL